MKINLVVDRYANVDRRSLKARITKLGVGISKRGYDYTIIVGGDGAFLNSAIKYMDKPLLHIGKKAADRGSLGRLSNGSIGELGSIVAKLKSGRFRIRKEPVLVARYMGREYRSAGDFFIERGNTKQAARYKYTINDNRDRIRGFAISNGIIVSTPMGSTGYYSYIERLRRSDPKRINGIGFAHILPAHISERRKGMEEEYKVRRVLGKGARVSVVFTRNTPQYLYGIPGINKGIRIMQGKRIVFKVGRNQLKYIELG